MIWQYIALALVLLLAITVGLIRVVYGPTTADRMVAAQLFGTCGVAILLLLGKGMQNEVLFDIALVVALLAALSTMTFVRRTWLKEDRSDQGEGDA